MRGRGAEERKRSKEAAECLKGWKDGVRGAQTRTEWERSRGDAVSGMYSVAEDAACEADVELPWGEREGLMYQTTAEILGGWECLYSKLDRDKIIGIRTKVKREREYREYREHRERRHAE